MQKTKMLPGQLKAFRERLAYSIRMEDRLAQAAEDRASTRLTEEEIRERNERLEREMEMDFG